MDDVAYHVQHARQDEKQPATVPPADDRPATDHEREKSQIGYRIGEACSQLCRRAAQLAHDRVEAERHSQGGGAKTCHDAVQPPAEGLILDLPCASGQSNPYRQAGKRPGRRGRPTTASMDCDRLESPRSTPHRQETRRGGRFQGTWPPADPAGWRLRGRSTTRWRRSRNRPVGHLLTNAHHLPPASGTSVTTTEATNRTASTLKPTAATVPRPRRSPRLSNVSCAFQCDRRHDGLHQWSIDSIRSQIKRALGRGSTPDRVVPHTGGIARVHGVAVVTAPRRTDRSRVRRR